MKKLFCLVTLPLLSIFLGGMNPSSVQADSTSAPAQTMISEELTPLVVAPDRAYDYFIRGLEPEANAVSAFGNLTTNTSIITFDVMQLASYDAIVLKDMLGNTIASQPLPNKLQLNRITFSNLKNKLKVGQVYSCRVTSSEGVKELPLFFTLPVE